MIMKKRLKIGLLGEGLLLLNQVFCWMVSMSGQKKCHRSGTKVKKEKVMNIYHLTPT